MFSDIDLKRWKRTFAFDNNNEVMMRLKYSHKWYFPVMLVLMGSLLTFFLFAIIGLFSIIESGPEMHIFYVLSVAILMLCWTLLYFFVQNKATAPYKKGSRGHLIFEERMITIKHTETNEAVEYKYSQIRNIYLNKKTCGLAITDNYNHTIFNEIMSPDEISEILNIMYEMTKTKPKIK